MPTEDQTFNRLSADDLKQHGSEFEHCKFINCDFQGAYLSNLVFIDCEFQDCNIALCDFKNTGLQNVVFTHCKLSGVDFSKTRDFLFKVRFADCLLDNAIFYRKKNKNGKFINCSCTETDFTDADLTGTLFDNCNLHRAFFGNTILKDADFTTSYNFTIDPDANMLKKTKFSVHGLPGLLTKYDIVVK
ncbi:pentapeptide repeat-containing protein [Mucilaginibacter ginkgonis]|uniref:Pentapeptide repeat-containing protein n=1 Tax=Mucilaginibacter ginkgonis TaxID=2682091 RepID=A0A6I4I5V5_9SPHI|nr:pentapeptide repeat-containing protein [Mucilaginibacter ginkgonis]QQL48556.1 pentapeptide repeat-containing protein [Mucilaginibacter ginkgonis]